MASTVASSPASDNARRPNAPAPAKASTRAPSRAPAGAPPEGGHGRATQTKVAVDPYKSRVQAQTGLPNNTHWNSVRGDPANVGFDEGPGQFMPADDAESDEASDSSTSRDESGDVRMGGAHDREVAAREKTEREGRRARLVAARNESLKVPKEVHKWYKCCYGYVLSDFWTEGLVHPERFRNINKKIDECMGRLGAKPGEYHFPTTEFQLYVERLIGHWKQFDQTVSREEKYNILKTVNKEMKLIDTKLSQRGMQFQLCMPASLKRKMVDTFAEYKLPEYEKQLMAPSKEQKDMVQSRSDLVPRYLRALQRKDDSRARKSLEEFKTLMANFKHQNRLLGYHETNHAIDDHLLGDLMEATQQESPHEYLAGELPKVKATLELSGLFSNAMFSDSTLKHVRSEEQRIDLKPQAMKALMMAGPSPPEAEMRMIAMAARQRGDEPIPVKKLPRQAAGSSGNLESSTVATTRQGSRTVTVVEPPTTNPNRSVAATRRSGREAEAITPSSLAQSRATQGRASEPPGRRTTGRNALVTHATTEVPPQSVSRRRLGAQPRGSAQTMEPSTEERLREVRPTARFVPAGARREPSPLRESTSRRGHSRTTQRNITTPGGRERYISRSIDFPPIRDGFTKRGTIMGVNHVGPCGLRFLINKGTEKNPRPTLLPGSEFGRSRDLLEEVEEGHLSFPAPGVDPKDRRSKHLQEILWVAEVEMSLTSTRTIRVFGVQWHSDSRKNPYQDAPLFDMLWQTQMAKIWTWKQVRTELYEEGRRNTRKAENFLDEAKFNKLHPDTGRPLRSHHRKTQPWLFPDDAGSEDESGSEQEEGPSYEEARYTGTDVRDAGVLQDDDAYDNDNARDVNMADANAVRGPAADADPEGLYSLSNDEATPEEADEVASEVNENVQPGNDEADDEDTPEESDSEAEFREDGEAYATLIDCNARPCYPIELGSEVPTQSDKYEEIVSYWRREPGVDRRSELLVFSLQLARWQSFCRSQLWDRRSKHHFADLQRDALERRRQHGLDGTPILREEPKRQGDIDNWMEYQDFELRTYKHLEKKLKDAQAIVVSRQKALERDTAHDRMQDIRRADLRFLSMQCRAEESKAKANQKVVEQNLELAAHRLEMAQSNDLGKSVRGTSWLELFSRDVQSTRVHLDRSRHQAECANNDLEPLDAWIQARRSGWNEGHEEGKRLARLELDSAHFQDRLKERQALAAEANLASTTLHSAEEKMRFAEAALESASLDRFEESTNQVELIEQFQRDRQAVVDQLQQVKRSTEKLTLARELTDALRLKSYTEQDMDRHNILLAWIEEQRCQLTRDEISSQGQVTSSNLRTLRARPTSRTTIVSQIKRSTDAKGTKRKRKGEMTKSILSQVDKADRISKPQNSRGGNQRRHKDDVYTSQTSAGAAQITHTLEPRRESALEVRKCGLPAILRPARSSRVSKPSCKSSRRIDKRESSSHTAGNSLQRSTRTSKPPERFRPS
ncbi:MAG: hypothetical protein M1828_007022 [Chrysothrix sp. TS-e1954]|nr:MAG: hypothetical protein M1828_007022 [Chrysothrix sp. TS-e1954]